MNLYKLHSAPEQLFEYEFLHDKIPVFEVIKHIRNYRNGSVDDNLPFDFDDVLKKYPWGIPLVGKELIDNLFDDGNPGVELINYALYVMNERWPEMEKELMYTDATDTSAWREYVYKFNVSLDDS